MHDMVKIMPMRDERLPALPAQRGASGPDYHILRNKLDRARICRSIVKIVVPPDPDDLASNRLFLGPRSE